MKKKIKKFKTETSGYYFEYIRKQHPFYKDQTEKWALLYEENSGQMISELNTEADKVHGMDEFTHKEVIDWFDSILNPESRLLSGVQLIDQERRRQINDEKWSKEHDSQHTNGELANAAALYAMTEETVVFINEDWGNDMHLHFWPFDLKWLKFTPDNRVKQLAKAGALIAAEIDRLQAASE